MQDIAGADWSDGGRRVIAVTGAGKGLGRAFAQAWARRGARVVISNRVRPGEPSSAESLAAALRLEGLEAIADTSDVRDPDAPRNLVNAALGAFGRLDGLILNAGVTGPAARLEQQSMADFREVMETNLFANVSFAQAAAPALRDAGAGRLLFVASSAGMYGVHGRAPYAASKGALIALALSLARELKRDGIGVNVIAPYAATQMTPEALNAELGDLLRPDLAAPMAIWLTSAACAARGEVWTAGAGWFRRGRFEEGVGGGIAPEAGPADPAWIAAHAGTLASMAQGQGHPDAEAAFADLLGRVRTAGD